MCNFISEEYLKNVTWPLHYIAVKLLQSELFNTDFIGSKCTHGSNIKTYYSQKVRLVTAKGYK